MQRIEFFFDPTCPFCWITSRWIHTAANHRDIDITWRPFSLAIKNSRVTPSENDSDHDVHSQESLRLLRVMVAARDHEKADIGKLYTIAGIKYHVAGFNYTDELITQMLDEAALPVKLLSSAEDTSLDSRIVDEMSAVLDLAGQDIGVPAIVFVNDDGSRQGFFGPVLNQLPELQESLYLWDGLIKLATNKSFFELKRTRPDGDPDVFSTAHC